MEYPIVPYDPEFAERSKHLTFTNVDHIIDLYSKYIAEFGDNKWYDLGEDYDPGVGSVETDSTFISSSVYKDHFLSNFIPRSIGHVGMKGEGSVRNVEMDIKSFQVGMSITSISNDIFRKMPIALQSALSKSGIGDETVRITDVADEEDNSRLAVMEIDVNKFNSATGGGGTVLVTQSTIISAKDSRNCLESIQLTYNSEGVPISFEYATNYGHNVPVKVPFAVGLVKGEYSFILVTNESLTSELPRYYYRYMQIAVARVSELVNFLYDDGKKTP